MNPLRKNKLTGWLILVTQLFIPYAEGNKFSMPLSLFLFANLFGLQIYAIIYFIFLLSILAGVLFIKDPENYQN